jgi:hypothetical protein
MRPQGCHKRFFHSLMTSAFALSFAVPAIGHETADKHLDETTNSHDGNSQELLQTVQQLAAQVKALNAKLDAVAAEQAKSAEETKVLKDQLEAANAKLAALEPPTKSPTAAAAPVLPLPTTKSDNAVSQSDSNSREQTLQDRLNRLEENQEFLDSKLADQYQSKLESGSKYRVRFSGIFLMNLYGNHGTVDNQDFPELASEAEVGQSYRSFGGSLRQSQIGIEGFGPDIFGAHTSAQLRFDFSGNTTDAPNGAVMGNIRLRTGTFRMDWKDTSLVAGQDVLFFSPLLPTSLSSLAVPPLSYAGNLWGWTPQVRIERKIAMTENGSLKLSGGILDPLSGESPEVSQDREASHGEQSGMPAIATHISWEQKTTNGNFSLGAGGYYSRQNWGFARNIDSWAATVDLLVPITKYFQFSSEFYRGRAVGGIGGGIGQTIVASGTLDDPTSSVHGLNSLGGWAQLKWKPRTNFQVNGAYGQDNPFASQIRLFPVVPSEYEEALTRTRSWFMNFIYEPKSNIVLSLEYKRLSTFDIGPDGYATDRVNLSLGYIF